MRIQIQISHGTQGFKNIISFLKFELYLQYCLHCHEPHIAYTEKFYMYNCLKVAML